MLCNGRERDSGAGMRLQALRVGPASRDFAKDVAIVVIGVLLALWAGDVADGLRWGHAVKLAEESLHREIAFDDAYFQDRLTVGPCIDRRIAQAAALVEDAARNGSVGRVEVDFSGPGRRIESSEWETERASQTLTHFPRERLARLGTYYAQLQGFQTWSYQEDSAWTGLAVLAGGPKRLGSMDVALLRRDIATARHLEWLAVLNARRQLDLSRSVGVNPGPSRTDYVRRLCTP